MTEPLRPEHDPGTDPTTITPTPASPTPPPAAPLDPTATSATSAAAAPLTPVATAAVLDPAAAAAAATTPPRRSSRLRWVAAGTVVALVIGVSAIATLALTGASSTAAVLGYVPADSVMYAEVRLDLPGDQRRQVGEFLSAFPGFADQAALDTKLDEVLDRLISDGTDGEQTFTKDIKPWFDGELAVSVGPLPTNVSPDDPVAAAAASHGLALISIKDAALAQAWFTDVMTESGATGTTQDYGGTTLTVFASPEVPGLASAFAIIDGRVAVAGDLASVKAAVDTGGSSAFKDDEDLKAAMTAVDGDHLGFAFVDLEAVLDSAMSLAGESVSVPVDAAMAELVPDWAGGRLRIESDALVMDAVVPHVEAAPGPDQNRANGVAAWAPPTTVVLGAANDYGATLSETVDRFRQEPKLSDAFTQLDQAAGMVGGVEAAIGWLGDSGIVIADGGEALEGGLVSIPSDAAAAQQFLTTIRSFATLAGGGAGITVTDEDYAGTTITIVDLGPAADLAGMAGALSGGAVPSAPVSGLPDGHVQLAYAATDDIVVIGSGPDFVKSVLDAGAGESLADTARYRDLVGRVGAEHTGVAFVDIAALRTTLEGLMASADAADRAEYEESVKPFLTPFDAFVAATTVSDALDQHHSVITVK